MILTNYLLQLRCVATKSVLRDYRRQEFIVENAPEHIKMIDYSLTGISSPVGSTPVQGGGESKEDRLCALIDKKDVEYEKYIHAKGYFDELHPAWNRLTPNEQYMLTARYIDSGDNENGGIEKIKRKFHIEKTEAYERSKYALQKLADLLYGGA